MKRVWQARVSMVRCSETYFSPRHYSKSECSHWETERIVVETFIALSTCIDYHLAYYLYVLTSYLWSIPSDLVKLALCLSCKEQACQALQPHLQGAFWDSLASHPAIPFPIPGILAKAVSAVFLLAPALGLCMVLGFLGLVLVFSEDADWAPSLLLVWGRGVSVPVHSLDLSLAWQHLLQISRWGLCCQLPET